MTTYGPSTLTLAERLAGADAVVVISDAKLVRSTVDELSENPREIGTFELMVAETLTGEVPEVIELRAVRDADGPWPVPDRNRFLALLQRDEVGGGWLLVHDSAFPMRDNAFEYDEDMRGQRPARGGQRASIADVRRLLELREKQGRAYEDALREREGRQLEAERPRLPSEMPESSELATWLDVERAEGGREGKPSGRRPASRADRSGTGSRRRQAETS